MRNKLTGIIIKDNDDDGETAAGGRIAHLLQILVRYNIFPEFSHSLQLK